MNIISKLWNDWLQLKIQAKEAKEKGDVNLNLISTWALEETEKRAYNLENEEKVKTTKNKKDEY